MRTFELAFLAIVVCAATLAAAQDPPQGWLGYATGTYSAGTKITFMSAKWVVPPNPESDGLFFGIWFGIESADNMVLLQPVLPWFGSEGEGGWQIYTEAFDWINYSNRDSRQISVETGDEIYGTVTLNSAGDAYVLTNTNTRTNETSSMTVQIPNDKNGDKEVFNHAWVVFEKVPDKCSQMPPNGETTFYDIVIQYDGSTVTPSWTTAFVDDMCNCRANVVNATSIKLTWDP